MTMPYNKPSSNRLDWRGTLYCNDFYICGSNTKYQIIMPWENSNRETF